MGQQLHVGNARVTPVWEGFPSYLWLTVTSHVSVTFTGVQSKPRGGSRNSLRGGGGGSGPESFEGGGLGSRSVGIFIY